MSDHDRAPPISTTIEAIAGAIREELGDEVKACPGFRNPERAEPLNRAFRAVVRPLLATDGVPDNDLAASVSWALLVVARRRLQSEGWDDLQVKSLLEEEPGSPDDWLAFLILASRPQIEPLLDSDLD